MHDRFALFGTPDVSVEIAAALYEARFVPTLVVTMPDRPRGRGLHLEEAPLAQWAKTHEIAVEKPEVLDADFCARLASYDVPVGIVVAYGKILPQALIDAFPGGLYNIHYSLLPRWRGATPVESAILAGDTETGVSIQRLVQRLDAGPIVASAPLTILPDESAPELRSRLNALAGPLLVSIMPALLRGEIQAQEQDESLVTRARKTEKEDGEINLADDGILNYQKYRAYAGWPGIYTFFERNGASVRVIIEKARLEGNRFIIEMVKPEGKRAMPFADFLRTGARPR